MPLLIGFLRSSGHGRLTTPTRLIPAHRPAKTAPTHALLHCRRALLGRCYPLRQRLVRVGLLLPLPLRQPYAPAALPRSRVSGVVLAHAASAGQHEAEQEVDDGQADGENEDQGDLDAGVGGAQDLAGLESVSEKVRGALGE